MHYLNLEQIHAELLDILVVFDRFAHENDLRYSLDSGTLLGAVRHQGFIPWDDDLDVIMPRPDFERFVSLSAELPEGYELTYVETDGTSFPFGKLVNKRIAAQEKTWTDRERFLWLDIFPVDGMSEDEEQNMADYTKVRKLHHYRLFQTYPALSPIQNLIKKPIQFLMSIYSPAQKTARKMTKLALKYPFGSSEWCRDLVFANNPNARMRTADFDDLTTLEFGGKRFPAIPHWDEYLTSQYGDYMQLPPEDQRKTHHIKAWYVDD